jgi:hypothetical protein
MANINETSEESYDDSDHYMNGTRRCGLTEQMLDDGQLYKFKVIVIGIIVPLISIFGVPANICCVYVYGRKHMRLCSTNTYLRALAISDTGTILMSLWLFTFDTYRCVVILLR